MKTQIRSKSYKKQKGFITILAIGFLITCSILIVYLKDSVTRSEVNSAQYTAKTNAKWAIDSVKSWLDANQKYNPTKCLTYPSMIDTFKVSLTCSTYIDEYGDGVSINTNNYTITVTSGNDPSQIDFIETSDHYLIQYTQ